MKKKRIFVLSSLCAMLVGVGVVALSFNAPTEVSAAEVRVVNLKDLYIVGEEFSVPEATILVDGQEYPTTDYVVKFPNGVSYTSKKYLLEDMGTYTIIYSANINGETVRAEKTFVVGTSNYSVTSQLSSVEWKENLSLFAETPSEVSGLDVSIAEGDTFNYNVPIVLNEDITDVASFYIGMTDVRTTDMYYASKVYIRLTDCYDENNYIQFVFDYHSTYVWTRGNASGQHEVGISPNANGTLEIDGISYETFEEGRYGIWVSNGTTNIVPFTVAYDQANGLVYFKKTNGSYQIINQVTNADLYGDKIFKGFKTGEVYLSIATSDYLGMDNVPVQITNIAGSTGTALKAASYVDEVAPIIEIDYQPVDSNGIYCAVGTEMDLFPATAYDINMADDVHASVEYYGNSIPQTILVKDGKFTPTKAGLYKVIYTAIDVFGNRTQKTVNLTSVLKENGKNIDFEYGEELVDVPAGKDIVFPNYTAEGLNGEVLVKSYIKNLSNGASFKVEQGKTFLLDELGEYEVIYEYTDGIFEGVTSYKFNCITSDEVRFLDALSLPRYFIKNAKYSLEDVYAYTFSDGKKARIADCYVKFDDNDFVKVENIKKVQINANESVEFEFRYGGKTLSSGIIPVVDTGFDGTLRMYDYFVGDFTNNAENKLRYDSNIAEGNNKLSFINEIIWDNVDVTFTIPANAASYKAVKIILTDFYNRENVSTFTFANKGGKIAFTINDDNEIITNVDFNAEKTISFWYDKKINRFCATGDIIEEFVPNFTTHLCLVDIELCDIYEENASIILKRFGNQNLSATSSKDRIEAESYIDKSVVRVNVGDTTTIGRVLATDILSPILAEDVIVKVTDPLGNIVTSIDNILLDGTQNNARAYEIKLTQNGYYTTSYTVKDQNGNETPFIYRVYAADVEAPTMAFKNIKEGDTVKVALGAKHKVEAFTMNDTSSKCSSFVMVMDEKSVGVIWKVEEITFNYKGRYTVYVYVMDAEGNYVISYYYVDVQ